MCCGRAHDPQLDRCEECQPVLVSEQQVLATFIVVSGGDAKWRQGCWTFCDFGANQGIDERKLHAYVATRPAAKRRICEMAIYLFGAAYIGLSFPDFAVQAMRFADAARDKPGMGTSGGRIEEWTLPTGRSARVRMRRRRRTDTAWPRSGTTKTADLLCKLRCATDDVLGVLSRLQRRSVCGAERRVVRRRPQRAPNGIDLAAVAARDHRSAAAGDGRLRASAGSDGVQVDVLSGPVPTSREDAGSSDTFLDSLLPVVSEKRRARLVRNFCSRSGMPSAAAAAVSDRILHCFGEGRSHRRKASVRVLAMERFSPDPCSGL